jgi:hypothetical protein
MDSLGFYTAVIGGITGIVGGIAGALSLHDRWKHRKPALELFAPYFYRACDSETGRLAFNVLIRISNSSKRTAYLYPETMCVQLRSDWTWSDVQVLHVLRETAETDFNEPQDAHFGTQDVPYLRRFEMTAISQDTPLTRYICLSSDNEYLLTHPKGIRIEIHDCHLRKHVLLIDDFEEQRIKYDPTFRTSL